MSKQAAADPRLGPARLWIIVGGIGLVWIALHGLGILDPAGTFTIIVASGTAVVATIVGLRRSRPKPMWPWLTVLGALGMFLLGNILRIVFDTLGNLGPTRSLLPDMFALPAYAVLAVGVAALAGIGRGDRDDVDAILDAVITALAVLALAWVFLVVPFLAKGDVTLTVEILLATYPVASVFVLAMGARLMFGNSRSPGPAMWLSLAAIFCLLVGDVMYMLVDGNLIDLPIYLSDLPYTLAFLAYAVAVLHPTVGRVGQRRPSDEMAPTRGRLVSVSLALFVPTVVLVTGLRDMSTRDRVALGVITVLLVCVAVLRMWRALRQAAVSQRRLAHQATHDALTGLPNRAFLNEHISRALEVEKIVDGSVSLLHINIDRFGLVNDTMGHGQGDDLLKAVTARLSENIRDQDVVGRIGGDEFAIVVTGLEDEAQAVDFGERTRMMFHRPFSVSGTDIPITASVGIAFQPARTGNAESLMRDADTAVNNAKTRAGGDHAVCFDDSMREQVAERLNLERELRHALERGELELHYQPKLRLSDERVVGLEALLRWQHPELGQVRPDRFIPIAEDTGMIVEIGAWVIDQACAQLARLANELSVANLVMSVNVSARQLRSDSLTDTTARALVRHGIPASSLCLELTESVLMDNLDAVRAQLEMIQGYGTQVSIDDFGTGYSSLAYLSGLPVDELKIDRSFVRALDTDPHAADVIGAVVSLASSIGLRTVAEGAETREQVDQLKALGCDETQGFYFAKPVPADELPACLSGLGVNLRPVLRSVPPPFPAARTTACAR